MAGKVQIAAIASDGSIYGKGSIAVNQQSQPCFAQHTRFPCCLSNHILCNTKIFSVIDQASVSHLSVQIAQTTCNKDKTLADKSTLASSNQVPTLAPINPIFALPGLFRPLPHSALVDVCGHGNSTTQQLLPYEHLLNIRPGKLVLSKQCGI